MDAKLEVEGYEVQIKEINEALVADPGNTELVELKAELETLVDLLRKSLGQSSSATPSASTSSSKPSQSSYASSSSSTFTSGTQVLAKWRKDGKFYPARITQVSGSSSDPVYTVIFDIDKSTEVVRTGEVKVLSESKKRSFAAVNADSDDGNASSSAAGKGKGKAAANAAAKTEKKAVKEEVDDL